MNDKIHHSCFLKYKDFVSKYNTVIHYVNSNDSETHIKADVKLTSEEIKNYTNLFIEFQDKNAFTFLFLHFKNYFYTIATGYYSEQEKREDLIQDVYLYLLNRKLNLNAQEFNFKNYFGICIRNAFINKYRKAKNHRIVDIDILPEQNFIQEEDSRNYNLLNQIIETLSPIEKEVVKFRFLGMKFCEISKKINVNQITLRVRYGKALKKLKERKSELQLEYYSQ